jgi:hypothetical protein
MKPPVLIVTYARSGGLIRLLEDCASAGITKFYVAVDGPRSDLVLDQQRIMREFLANFEKDSSLNVNVWWRNENLGPAVSVLTAINWFFGNEEEGIILEDDLEPEPDFFKFAEANLAAYRESENIWIIAGSRLIDPNSEFSEALWSLYPMTWGWATWANRWQLMYQELLSTPKTSWRNWFDRRANYWDVGSRRSKAGYIDAWDLPLASAQFRLKKLTLIPPVNLIRNIGFDAQATHTVSNNFPLNVPTFKLPVKFNQLEMPKKLRGLDYDIDLEQKVYFIALKHSLLRVWSNFTDKYFLKLIYGLPLEERLKSVLIPKSSTAP